MAEPLIFLGAGASAYFGIPTMKDFVEDFSKVTRKFLVQIEEFWRKL